MNTTDCILYVDDELPLLEMGKLFLERSGHFSVDTIDSPVKALTLLHSRTYDLVISDYQMPDMDGIAFLKAVRERFGDLPFILFTGKGREEVVIEAINNGADFYLQKGGDVRAQFAELAHVIRHAVQKRKTEQELRRSESTLRSFIETNRESVTIVDEEGKVLEWNPGAERITGISHNEALGRYVWDLTFRMVPAERRTEAYRAHIEERIRASLKTGVPVFDEPQVIESRGPDGTRIYTRQTVFPIKTEKGFGIASIAQDITGEKLAEIAMRESEKKYHDLAELLPQVVFEADRDGILTYLNRIAFQYFGYTDDEFRQGINVTQMLVPGDVERASATFRSLIEGKVTTVGTANEYTALRKDQSSFPVSIYSTPILVEGSITGIRGVVVDITERTATQSAMQAVIESTVGTTGLSSLQRIVETVSSWLGAECVMIGEIQPDHDTVKVLSMILDGRRVDDFIYHLKGTPCVNVAEKGFCYYPSDSVRLFPDAKDINELNIQGYVGAPLWNSQGKVSGIICALSRSPMHLSASVQKTLGIIAVKAAVEVERIQMEHELRESQRLTGEAMDLANLVNWKRDPKTGLLTLNDRFYALYGTTAEREGGFLMTPERYIREFVHPDDHDYVAAAFSRPPPTSPIDSEIKMEHRIIRRDGEIRTVLVRVGMSHGSGGKDPVINGANQDITDRKKMETAIKEAYKKLSLLSGVTRHDIRNQLMTLNGYVSLLEQSIPDTSCQHFFSRITKACSTIEKMIQFTREYEEIGRGAPIWQDLSSVITAASKGSIPGQCTLYNDLPSATAVLADPMLEKVFFNLLDNAVRHGGWVTHIRVSSRTSEGNLVIVWEDNGVGIAPVDKERIFERGFGKNTGHGMFLVREILSLTGISITETGEEGGGARFEMVVPQGAHRTIPS
jgi:PAS domain S-box-containing protein